MTTLRPRVLGELQRRNYSSETTHGYIHAIKEFAEYFGKSPEQLGGHEIRRFGERNPLGKRATLRNVRTVPCPDTVGPENAWQRDRHAFQVAV